MPAMLLSRQRWFRMAEPPLPVSGWPAPSKRQLLSNIDSRTSFHFHFKHRALLTKRSRRFLSGLPLGLGLLQSEVSVKGLPFHPRRWPPRAMSLYITGFGLPLSRGEVGREIGRLPTQSRPLYISACRRPLADEVRRFPTRPVADH